jgi:hypothetical protein
VENLKRLNIRYHTEDGEQEMMNDNFARLDQPQGKVTNRSTIAIAIAFLLATTLLLVPASKAQSSGGNNSFGFNSTHIAGFPTGAVRLTGGGVFNLATGFVNSSGGFNCTASVNQGPLSGCLAGQGVRWDTSTLLASTPFKCSANAAEPLKVANTSSSSTSPDTVVLLADFYRASNGNDESFTAKMIVSTRDLAPDVPGVQNVWIQGVGCGSATVNFNQ